ncbi:hypothetical protein ACS127_01755 [Amphibacillus sp. Q70]|uniref:hypothetical protein n=1 Tax=Amphibacillus sp. Q70 TaxID=3453416 RepID=UPI003F83EBE4
MWWIIVIFVAIMLFSKLDDIIELYKGKSPDYQKEKEQQQLERDHERSEIIQLLKDSIDLDCQIESDDLIYMSIGSKVVGKVINVDDEWVELLTTKRARKQKMKLFLKIEHISSVSKVL